MKKILAAVLFCLISSTAVTGAVKVNLSFGNFRITSGSWTVDVIAKVLPGQTWRAGSSNIRVEWFSYPANAISVKEENPCFNPNPNLHNNPNYLNMTSTPVSGGACVSLNITAVNNCHLFRPGTYVLGSIRFDRLDSTGCVRLNIRANSVLQDSLTQMLNNTDWTTVTDSTCYRIDYLTGITASSELPRAFKLFNNFPNPFNPNTLIRFDISKGTFASIIIYDILGREVLKLVNEKLNPGKYEINFDGTNYPSGVYFYKLETEYYRDTKKMILIK